MYALHLLCYSKIQHISGTHEMLWISYGPSSCTSSLCSLVKFLAYHKKYKKEKKRESNNAENFYLESKC